MNKLSSKLICACFIMLALTIGGSDSLGDYKPWQKHYLISARFSSSISSDEIFTRVPVLPEYLYARVWDLVLDDFYDKTFNGQSWKRWQHKYDGKLHTLEDAHKAIETALISLGDRYSRFLDQEQFADEKSQIKAKLCGIGVQIGIDKNHRLSVIAPMDGSPALKAGIKTGDEVIEINGTSTKGMEISNAAKLIRGVASSKVNLVIQRGSQKIKILVTRAEIPIKVVTVARMLDNEVGYIRLNSFLSSNAYNEVKDALGKLSKARGIILDLRDNPGGLLSNAISISSLFLNTGTVVSTIDRNGYKTTAPCNGRPICINPVVVLVNHGSASASEITSAALQDNNRALLIGEQTYGKGLVQGVYRLLDGSGVNITIARYLTPSGDDINKIGITPDQVVNLTYADYKNRKGPWWFNIPSSSMVNKNSTDLKDAQLNVAIGAIRKQIFESKTKS